MKKNLNNRAAFSHNNSIRLIHGGAEFFELLIQLIDGATHCVHLHTYIFSDDETGTAIADALVNAAKRNVKVYMLIDGYASGALPQQFVKNLEDAGVSFRFFKPIFKSKSLYFGRRLHHKVVVVDGIDAVVGGVNIADRYNDLPGQKAWLDFVLYAHGDASRELYQLCCRLWTKKRSNDFALPQILPEKAKDIHTQDHCSVRVRRNDWVKRKQEVWKTYLEIFKTANQSITILCSYFMPGNTFRKALQRAAKRGVSIKVILTAQSDIRISKYAERYLYRWMLRNAILIYEYQPAILHAKMAIADDQLLTIGSYNINNISAYASIELNLDVQNKAFSEKVQAELEQIISKDCTPINSFTYSTKLYSIQQLLQWSAFQVIRFFLTISTFYFRQKE